jgi:hypothetical protein
MSAFDGRHRLSVSSDAEKVEMLAARRWLRVQPPALETQLARALPARCLSTTDNSENWSDFNNVAKVCRR